MKLFELRNYLGHCALVVLLLVAMPGLAVPEIIISNDNNAKGLKGQTFEVLKKEITKRPVDKVMKY